MNCADTAQNAITEGILGGMVGRYFTSIDPLCPTKDGIAFWLASLTTDQSVALEKQSSAVRAIMPDPAYSYGDLRRNSSPNKRSKIPARAERGSLKKRDTLIIERQDPADSSLCLLSSPSKGAKPQPGYSFFSEAGRSILVYVIDSGLNLAEPDLRFTNIEFIYALDVVKEESDLHKGRHGTCMATKIAGSTFGVAKKTSLVAVKTRSSVGSFMDALGQIVSHLHMKTISGQKSRGWTVISVGGGWRSKDAVADAQDLIALRIEGLVQTLTRDYQVVLVASAGEDLEESYGDIGIWPGRFASDYDMITVGAVQSEGGDDFGRRFAWSAGGDAVSVSGPGNGLCAYLDDELYTVEGASFANAVVSGLVAYFLSIQALQRHFQNQANLPAAVRDYLVSMSSRRYEAQRSVWNGLDYANPSTMFDDLQTLNSKNPDAPTTPYPVWKGIPRPRMIE